MNEVFDNPTRFHEELAKVSQAPQEPVTQNNNEGVEHDNNETEADASLPAENAEGGEENELASEDHGLEGDEALQKTNFIPKSRFNKEIEKRRALEEQLHQEREAKIRYETQLQMLQQMQEMQAAQASQSMPQGQDAQPELDPLDLDAHNLYMQKLQELEKKIESFNQETSQKTQQLQYFNLVSAQENAFEKQNPDFKDALEHLKNVELQVAKNFYDESQAQAYVTQKMQTALMSAINSGKNAAEVMYNMAKTYGYTPKSAQKAAPSPNLDAINNNMKKTASIHSLNNSVGLGNNNNVHDIKHLLRDPKNPSSGIDPDKFQQMLGRMTRNP
jgi:hypothetical protein